MHECTRMPRLHASNESSASANYACTYMRALSSSELVMNAQGTIQKQIVAFVSSLCTAVYTRLQHIDAHPESCVSALLHVERNACLRALGIRILVKFECANYSVFIIVIRASQRSKCRSTVEWSTPRTYERLPLELPPAKATPCVTSSGFTDMIASQK